MSYYKVLIAGAALLAAGCVTASVLADEYDVVVRDPNWNVQVGAQAINQLIADKPDALSSIRWRPRPTPSW